MGNWASNEDENATDRQSSTNVSLVKRPRPFMTEEEFFKTWPTWKTDFFMFQKELLKNTSDQKDWGDVLLNLMGPIGQNIYSTFTFTSVHDKENVDVLLQLFDEFFIFATRKKLPRENVYEYINSLQQVVNEKGVQNGEKAIKKQILKEIDEVQFTIATKELFPAFVFLGDYKKLTLKEMAFIWDYYNNSSAIKGCPGCAGNHTSDKCLALGKQCVTCKDLNHFPKRYPPSFIHNCNYCDGSHVRKNCPAYNETCTKCKKQHHFSWKCQQVQLIQCHFCNMSHGASRSVCPTKDSTSTIWQNVEDFASACKRRRV